MTEGREIPLHFTQTGNGANALVFFHGFLDDGSFWRSTIEALEARDFSVVTLDFPGGTVLAGPARTGGGFCRRRGRPSYGAGRSQHGRA